MHDLGKMFVVIGAGLVIVGIVLWSGFGRGWLGRLPGDINYTNTKGNFSFHFPIVTCIIVSLLLTIILRLFRR